MPEYLCLKCKGVFCGWSVKYKYKGRCPKCGSELQEVYPDNQKFQKNLIDKMFKIRDRKALRKN